MSQTRYPHLKHHWYPVLASHRLTKQPKKITLLGQQIVLVRLAGQVSAYPDCCPHRQVPLSKGHIANDRLVCCYHGWEFDAKGQLVHTPGVSPCRTHAKLQSYQVQELDGLIWLQLQASEQPLTPFRPLSGYSMAQEEHRVIGCSLFHSIENFLDPCHTHYVHRGLLRNSGPQDMQIQQCTTDTGFETHFLLGEPQNGWINRLFDPGVNINIGRFELPGRVELDYNKHDKLLLRVALYFVPQDDVTTQLLTRIYVPKAWYPDTLRFALYRPFLKALYRQDKEILELHQRTQTAFGEKYRFADTDIVARPLWALLNQQSPKPVSTEHLDFSRSTS